LHNDGSGQKVIFEEYHTITYSKLPRKDRRSDETRQSRTQFMLLFLVKVIFQCTASHANVHFANVHFAA